MTETEASLHGTGQGISPEVLLSGACLGLGLAVCTFLAADEPTGLAFAVLAGWCVFSVAAGILLDRSPGAPGGRFLAGLSLIPVLCAAWAAVRKSSLPAPAELTEVLPELAGMQAALVAVALPWMFCRPVRTGRLLASGVVVAAGAVLVAIVAAADVGVPWPVVAWTTLGGGAVLFWWEQLVQAVTSDRTARRRTTWTVATVAGSALAVGCSWLFLADDAAASVTLAGLVVVALTVTRLSLMTEFRPIDEPALDVIAAAAALAAAALIGLLVLLGAVWIDLPSPWTPAAFGALLTLAVTAPVAVWLRRSATARRYGTGTISPTDVARITADLNAQTDARELLDKAARMIATASGSPEVRVVLGAEPPDPDQPGIQHPLVVGGERVGALIVVPADREGLEPRQDLVIEQLLPTVALVARAVDLAVETEHARLDVTREREAERRRILNDLHDGLGPVLAGMSMRVQGALRTQSDPEVAGLLGELGSDLATSRADLRRIVSGLTPSALRDGNLEPALTRLLRSFDGTASGPRLALDFAVDRPLGADVEVAVYRLVAEGVTNAVRHASARNVAVAIRTEDSLLSVHVVDDGAGGPVHPGVGLTSMGHRAEELGGTMAVDAGPDGGVALRLELPLPEGVRP